MMEAQRHEKHVVMFWAVVPKVSLVGSWVLCA
jgi:hypothetical protein